MPFWYRQCWCWCLWASWCSNRTTRFSLGSYFLGRGPSAPIPKFVSPCCTLRYELWNQRGLLATVPFEPEVRNPTCRTRWANFGFGTLGPVFTEHPNRTSRQRISVASAVTPNAKSIAASEDQAKSSVGVDATLPPGF